MAFYRTKLVKGHLYQYLQESYREGGRVKTRSVYLGPVAGGLPLGDVGVRQMRELQVLRGIKPRKRRNNPK